MIDINGTVFIQIANFVVLIIILNMLVFKPIRGMLRQRKAKIDNLEQNIQANRNEAETKNLAFDEGIKKARVRGQDQKETLIKQAIEDEKAIVAQINAKAQEDLAAVKQTIARDIDSVRSALEKEIDAFVAAIAHKILGRAA